MKKSLTKKSPIKTTKIELPTWNLTDFYQSINDKKIDQDFKIIEKECEIFCQKYQNKIAKIDAKNLFLISKILFNHEFNLFFWSELKKYYIYDFYRENKWSELIWEFQN